MADHESIKTIAYSADQLQEKGQLEEALNMALEAVRCGAQESELFFIAAKIAFQLGDLEKALQLVQRLLALDPEHLNGWILFGEINLLRNDTVRGRYGHQRAFELFPALGEFGILPENQMEEKARTIDSFIDESSFNTVTFAEICVGQGYLDKALAVYSDLLKRDPEDEILKERVEELKRKLKEK